MTRPRSSCLTGENAKLEKETEELSVLFSPFLLPLRKRKETREKKEKGERRKEIVQANVACVHWSFSSC